MHADPFVSYGGNNEDVVLFRALAEVSGGRYVEVGAGESDEGSVTRSFYARGWNGITFESAHDVVERHRVQRPRDLQIEVSVGEDSGLLRSEVTTTGSRFDDILASAGWDGLEIHFIVVHSADAVRPSIDLGRWQPWVLVTESAADSSTHAAASWERLADHAGYSLCLFDGQSHFYVSPQRRVRLAGALSYPACARDNYVPHDVLQQRIELEQLRGEAADLRDSLAQAQEKIMHLTTHPTRPDDPGDELLLAREHEAMATASAVRWRQKAVGAWANASTSGTDLAEYSVLREQTRQLRDELAAIRHTISWRVTAPLRTMRKLAPHRTHP